MSWIRQRNEVKLDLLQSLARSQRALARMIEALADVTEQSSETAANLKDNIHSITEYQRAMAEKVMGITLPDSVRRSKGLSQPWTNEQVGVTPHAAQYPNNHKEN
ncbi:MAG: hypothetical protein K0R67_3885 [Paenibacillus sp.]|jgi:hypothetical protein|nr:hypothetical protein [Paenibacillus sp.]